MEEAKYQGITFSIYTLYFFKNREDIVKRLKNQIQGSIYTPSSPVSKDYLCKISAEKITERIKREKGKTIFLKEIPDKEVFFTFLKYSRSVYLQKENQPSNADELYLSTGTLPILCNSVLSCDYIYPDPTVKGVVLPKEMEEIRPKEFSPLLFGSIIFEELKRNSPNEN